ncbi:MAG: hypothetical protein LBN11_03560, partial [Tannerella sp.]|nr:hypothetical protein [Tannerella sp.]
MTKFFLAIYDYFARHRRQLFALLSALVVLFVVLTLRLRFKEDISGFLPDNKENEQINNAYRYIASSNKITIFCTGADST